MFVPVSTNDFASLAIMSVKEWVSIPCVLRIGPGLIVASSHGEQYVVWSGFEPRWKCRDWSSWFKDGYSERVQATASKSPGNGIVSSAMVNHGRGDTVGLNGSSAHTRSRLEYTIRTRFLCYRSKSYSPLDSSATASHASLSNSFPSSWSAATAFAIDSPVFEARYESETRQ